MRLCYIFSLIPLISGETACLTKLNTQNDVPDNCSIDCSGCSFHKIYTTKCQ